MYIYSRVEYKKYRHKFDNDCPHIRRFIMVDNEFSPLQQAFIKTVAARMLAAFPSSTPTTDGSFTTSVPPLSPSPTQLECHKVVVQQCEAESCKRAVLDHTVVQPRQVICVAACAAFYLISRLK